MLNHYIHTNLDANEDTLAILVEHGAKKTVHVKSIEIELPVRTIQDKIEQEEDSLPEAGLSSMLEIRHYTLPSGLKLTYWRETVMTPRSFQARYGIRAMGLGMVVA